jgi:hypothetical protein
MIKKICKGLIFVVGCAVMTVGISTIISRILEKKNDEDDDLSCGCCDCK